MSEYKDPYYIFKRRYFETYQYILANVRHPRLLQENFHKIFRLLVQAIRLFLRP